MNSKLFSSFEDFLLLFDNVKRRGSQTTARCPSHDDKKNSLSIKLEEGKILMNCFAGCTIEEICAKLEIEIKDLFLDSDFQRLTLKKKMVAEYIYRDENRQSVHKKIRYQLPNGDKAFRQCQFDQLGKEVWNLKGINLVPYRLPEMIDELKANPEQYLFLTEGEKDCDNVRGLRLTASSFKDWKLSFNKHIKGVKVVLLVDHDKSGIKQANDAAKIISQAAANVKLVDLYENQPLPEKHGKDVSDWIAEDGNRAKLLKIVNAATKYGASKSNILTAREMLARKLEKLKWTIEGILTAGVTILAGRPKTGKSFTSLDFAVGVSSGGKIFGSINVEKGDVLYLGLEDGERRLQERLRKSLGTDKIPDGLFLATEWQRLDIGGLDAIEQWIQEHPQARLIIIDTLKRVRPQERMHSRLYDGDYDAIAPLSSLALKYGVSILVVHHTRKANSDDPFDLVSGSLGLTGAADAVLVLKRIRGQNEAVLHVVGRDVEEKELALKWDQELNGWSLIGDAKEHRRSKERQEIIKFLKGQTKPLTPKVIAQSLDRNYNATKKLLWFMSKDNQIQCADGRYWFDDGNHGNRVTKNNEQGYLVTEVTDNEADS